MITTYWHGHQLSLVFSLVQKLTTDSSQLTIPAVLIFAWLIYNGFPRQGKVLLSDLSRSQVFRMVEVLEQGVQVLLPDLSRRQVIGMIEVLKQSLQVLLSKSKVLLSDLSRSRDIRMIWGFETRFAQEVFDYVQSSEKNESTNKLLALMSISSDW